MDLSVPAVKSYSSPCFTDWYECICSDLQTILREVHVIPVYELITEKPLEDGCFSDPT